MKKINLNSTQLKLIAVIFMLLDHIHTYLNILPSWIVFLTRFVAPLFVYLLVEGFVHTSSRIKYLLRLLIAGVIMLVGNMVINIVFHQVDIMTGRHDVFSLIQGNNIFMTLALCFSVIWILETFYQKQGFDKVPYVIVFVLLALCGILVEGGPYLLPLAIIFYSYRQAKIKLLLMTGLFCVIVLMTDLIGLKSALTVMTPYQYFTFNSQFFMILVAPFIYWYNGQRGHMPVIGNKYFFYIIYPVHLWLLKVLSLIG